MVISNFGLMAIWNVRYHRSAIYFWSDFCRWNRTSCSCCRSMDQTMRGFVEEAGMCSSYFLHSFCDCAEHFVFSYLVPKAWAYLQGFCIGSCWNAFGWLAPACRCSSASCSAICSVWFVLVDLDCLLWKIMSAQIDAVTATETLRRSRTAVAPELCQSRRALCQYFGRRGCDSQFGHSRLHSFGCVLRSGKLILPSGFSKLSSRHLSEPISYWRADCCRVDLAAKHFMAWAPSCWVSCPWCLIVYRHWSYGLYLFWSSPTSLNFDHMLWIGNSVLAFASSVLWPWGSSLGIADGCRWSRRAPSSTRACYRHFFFDIGRSSMEACPISTSSCW